MDRLIKAGLLSHHWSPVQPNSVKRKSTFSQSRGIRMFSFYKALQPKLSWQLNATKRGIFIYAQFRAQQPNTSQNSLGRNCALSPLTSNRTESHAYREI